jgi:tetratricopeptide (TPR) repeat protein
MLFRVPRPPIAITVLLLLAAGVGAGDGPPLPTGEDADRYFDLLRRVSPLPGDLRTSESRRPDIEEEDDLDLLFGAPRALLLGESPGGSITLSGRRISVKAPLPTAPSVSVRDDWRGAIAALRKGADPAAAIERIRAATDDPRVEYLSGLAAFAGGKPADAAESFSRSAMGEGLKLPSRLLEGAARIEAGMPGKAVAPLRTAMEISPDRPAARALLGEALARCRRLKEAAKVLEPIATSKGAGPRIRFLYARSLVLTDRPKPAIPILDALIRAGTHRYGALVVLGMARLRLDEPEAAIATLDRALVMRPKALLPAAVKVPALKAAGKDEAALALARSLLESHPGKSRAWRTAVYAELAAGHSEKAVAAAREWRRRFPKSVGAGIGLVRALLAAGRNDEAESVLADVEKKHPKLPAVATLRKKLNESR